MNEIHFDQTELLTKFASDSKLADMICFFEKEAEKIGQVVCRVRVNDLSLLEEDEERLGTTLLEHISSLELLMNTPDEVAKGMIMGWIEQLPELIKSIDETSTRVRFEGVGSCGRSFQQIIRNAQLLVGSLQSLKTYLNPQDWTLAEAKFKKAFEDLVIAVDQKKASEIADILEYDLADAMQDWRIHFKSLLLEWYGL